MFDIKLADNNHTFVLVFSMKLLHIMRNTPTVVGIICRGGSCKFLMHSRLIVIDILIYNKISVFWVGGSIE